MNEDEFEAWVDTDSTAGAGEAAAAAPATADLGAVVRGLRPVEDTAWKRNGEGTA